LRLVVAGRKIQRIKRKSLVGQSVLVIIALQVLFVSSFINVQLPTGTGKNLLNCVRVGAQYAVHQLPPAWQPGAERAIPELMQPVSSIRWDAYTPQTPIAIFLGYAFGWPIATIAAGIYLISGIIGPFFGYYFFASGGGLDYYLQPGFGYLLGMIAATWATAQISGTVRTSFRQVLALLAGLVCIHGVGTLYVLGCSLTLNFLDSSSTTAEWLPWVFEQIRNLSWYSLPYDAIFGLVLIGLGFPIRYLVGLLTAPDIGLKSQADIQAQRQIEELLHF
jgi:biotin transporter BioY